MDIQTKKINFIQEFLSVDDEELINKLDSLLKLEKKKKSKHGPSPYSEDEFNVIIDKSEKDAKEGKVISVEDLKNDIDAWS
jgi:hypothetical protein